MEFLTEQTLCKGYIILELYGEREYPPLVSKYSK